jgi:AcrR family transcriptional regulator
MARSSPAAVDEPLDRPARSRLRISEACLDLLREGVLQPSADQIAARAGLSRRSIFYHFADLAALYDAVVEAGMQRYAPLLREIPTDLPVGSRVAAVAEVRADFFEATAPFTRALTVQSLVGTAGDEARRVSREALAAQRADITRLFGPDLDGLEADERSETLEALAAAAGAPTWEHLRRGRSLAPAAARRVVTRTLRAILRDVGADVS